jgi:hypothetical protein
MSRLVIQGRIGINKPFSYFERRNFIMKESWREQVFNKRLRAIFNSLLRMLSCLRLSRDRILRMGSLQRLPQPSRRKGAVVWTAGVFGLQGTTSNHGVEAQGFRRAIVLADAEQTVAQGV